MVVKHNIFDYEVVTESPPRSSYFSKPKGEEGLRPRRISASPPEQFKSNQIPSESVEIIDLVDDPNEENILNERKPNSSAKSAPKKPSAINRAFKCPYPDSSNRQSTKRKASAILAGFERQKEICEPRKKASISGNLLGQKKSVASKSTVTKRPTKPSSLKQFFNGKS